LSYDRRNKNVFSLCRKVNRDVAVAMSSGSEFHSLAPMTGEFSSPTAVCHSPAKITHWLKRFQTPAEDTLAHFDDICF